MNERLWKFAFSTILILSRVGSMFLSAAYVAPVLVGYPTPRFAQSTAQAIEVAVMFGGLVAGFVMGVVGLGALEKRLFSSNERRLQQQEFEDEVKQAAPLLRALARFVDRLMR